MPKIAKYDLPPKHKAQQGFTLIELLLVVVIIGILLAVIVPRAWRANVDAKYGVVRQNGSELAAFANEWAEQMLQAQDDTSTSTLTAYYASLAENYEKTPSNNYVKKANAQWIGRKSSNWNSYNSGPMKISGRSPNTIPEASIEDIVPPERYPRNPFNGRNVFRDRPSGDNADVVPGMYAAGMALDNDFVYFALVFQGTDSKAPSNEHGYSVGGDPKADEFHAGMALNLSGLRNGIFMARLANGQE